MSPVSRFHTAIAGFAPSLIPNNCLENLSKVVKPVLILTRYSTFTYYQVTSHHHKVPFAIILQCFSMYPIDMQEKLFWISSQWFDHEATLTSEDLQKY